VQELVGRDVEVAEIDRFLDRLASGPAALVLEGPAGIGKTALWSTTVERARARGIRILQARPTGAEASYAYQGLADLVGPLLDGGGVALPPPQQRALAVALLREAPAASGGDGEGGGVDPQLVSLAATTAVLQASRDDAILIAIDDAPWLDPATASALAFVARRLGERRIGFVVTQRAEEPGAAPLDLESALPTERRWLAPLSHGALHALLAARLGLTLPRPTLARLHEMSQGNPFHALEMGRALQRLPAVPRPGDPFPIPESLRGLIVQRLVPLSTEARRTLLLAALAGSPTSEELAGALRDEALADDALAEAIDAGLVAVEAGRVRFSHPLIASTVAAAASESQRQVAHRALAAVVAEPEARGRHLAMATTRPAADVAGALEEAAIDARRRAATDTAVELYRLALDRTPSDDTTARDRRRVRLAAALFDQSDLPAARALLRAAIPELPPGPLRAEARMIDGTIGWYLDSGDTAASILRLALPDATDDRELLGRIHYRLSIFEIDLRDARRHGFEAVRLLEGSDAGTTQAAAMFQTFWAGLLLGEPPDLDLFERALARESGGHIDKSTIPAIWYAVIDRPDLARARIHGMLERARCPARPTS
jgi:hypothetical protein